MPRFLKIACISLVATIAVVAVFMVWFVKTDPGIQFAVGLLLYPIVMPVMQVVHSWVTPKPPTPYFRLHVDLTYKGAPFPLDVVVGCNVNRGQSLDGALTYEAFRDPYFAGRRTEDGKAILVRSPDACQGQTSANGRVPPAFLPLVVVYDNPDTLEFGWGYATPDAYDSSLSDLKLGRVIISKATAAEFEAARSEISFPDLVQLGPKPKLHPFGYSCRAMQRYRITEPYRAQIRSLWPTDHPRYWWTGDLEQMLKLVHDLQQMGRIISDRPDDSPELSKFMYRGIIPELTKSGLPVRGLTSRIDSNNADAPAPSVYPTAPQITSRNAPTTPAEWISFLKSMPQPVSDDVLVSEKYRGFSFCTDSLFGGTDETNPYVEDYVSAVNKGMTRVNGIRLEPAPQWRQFIFFETDMFLFIGTNL